jgi:cytochrome bd ubiquinol oxidase subunit II
MIQVVAAGLLLGVMAYALFAGADFGAGFWDLTAGRAGGRQRRLIDASLAPVWEANHTWLIYCLVVFWTAFPAAFAAVTSTLYIPLGLAALGIVLRGSGFAFREVIPDGDRPPLVEAGFATSSVVTPFFLGAAGGGIASGRVPARGYGDPMSSWLNGTSLLAGCLAVAVCAYLAGVFLTVDARRTDDRMSERWFRRRAYAAAWVAGAVSVAGLLVTRVDAPHLFHGLLGRALPLVALSVLAGLGTLILLRRQAAPLRVVRLLAGGAVACLVLGWGVAQYPYLLGDHATVTTAAAPTASLAMLVAVFCAAVVLVVPSLLLLYVLQQRGRLEDA